MRFRLLLVRLLPIIALVTSAAAQSPDTGSKRDGYAALNRRQYLEPNQETRTLTEHWFGQGDDLSHIGITTTLNLWTVVQGNVTGGLDTGWDWSGLYYFANHFDFEKMIGWQGGTAFVRIDGGWSNGVNDEVGAIMNVNGLAVGDEPIGLTRFWLQQDLFDERLRIRGGKLDASTESFEFHGQAVAFDANPYANTQRTQFLDSGLANNTAIPFTSAGLSLMFLVEPVDRLYVAGAVLNANSNQFRINANNVFGGNARWMYMLEAGVATELGGERLPGLLYAGYWYSDFEDSSPGQGFYLGASQLLFREGGTDDQGIGLFARYGYADRNSNGVRNFWSLGGQYKGLLDNRDHDILGIGWAQAFTDGQEFSASYEGVLEVYYRARLRPWVHVSPHVQFIINPGSNDIDDAVTLGVRAQITF